MSNTQRKTQSQTHKDATEEPTPSEPHWCCSDPNIGEFLFGFMTNDLTDEQIKLFNAHLQACTRCRADKIRLEAMTRIVRANPERFFGNTKPARTKHRDREDT